MRTVVQARIDEKCRKAAEDIFRRMGMSLSDGIRIFIHQVVNDQALPFRPSLGDEPSEELRRELLQAEEDIKAGRLEHYDSVDDFIAAMKRDD